MLSIPLELIAQRIQQVEEERMQTAVMAELGQLQTFAAPLDYPPDEIPLVQHRSPEPTVSPFPHLQTRDFHLSDTPWICLPIHPRDRSLAPWIWRLLSRIRRWTEERRVTPPANAVSHQAGGGALGSGRVHERQVQGQWTIVVIPSVITLRIVEIDVEFHEDCRN